MTNVNGVLSVHIDLSLWPPCLLCPILLSGEETATKEYVHTNSDPDVILSVADSRLDT